MKIRNKSKQFGLVTIESRVRDGHAAIRYVYYFKRRDEPKYQKYLIPKDYRSIPRNFYFKILIAEVKDIVYNMFRRAALKIKDMAVNVHTPNHGINPDNGLKNVT